MKKNILKNLKAFSIIEIMISIFVFTLWLMWVYAIIISTMNLNDYNKNYIIASNLAREQLELIRNIRDNNYKKVQNYNQIDPNSSTYTDVFQTWSYYKISNDFSSLTTTPIKVEKITSFLEWKDKLNTIEMKSYKLCLDWNNLYTYDCTTWNKQTVFYKYLKIEEVKDKNWIINDALKVTSKVIWNMRGYHETEISTILADWKRL